MGKRKPTDGVIRRVCYGGEPRWLSQGWSEWKRVGFGDVVEDGRTSREIVLVLRERFLMRHPEHLRGLHCQ